MEEAEQQQRYRAVKRLRDNPTEEKRKEWSVYEGAVDRSQREQQESGVELRTVGI